MTTPKTKAQKARSAAARKGWGTRLAREQREVEAALDREECEIQEALSRVRSDHVRPPPREMIPNDIETPRMRAQRWRLQAELDFAAARPPTFLQRILGWFR